MRKTLKKILAMITVFAVVITAIPFTARAALDPPAFPAYTVAEDSLGSITYFDQYDTELSIETTASGKAIVLSLVFPKEGGIRLYDAAKNGTNGIFAPEELSAITYSDNGSQLTATGANGTSVVLSYGIPDWELAVRNAENTVVYRLKASQLKTSYTGATRSTVGIYGSVATDEKFIGLGERYSGVVLNGKSYELWNKDCWSEGNDSYVNVPLLHSNKGYSLFFNSFYAGKADIGASSTSTFSMDFAGPDIDLYVWTGTPLENLKSYLALTGTNATIPEWAVHYWAGGSDYWYWIKEEGQEGETVNVLKEMLKGYQALGTMPSAVYGENTLTKQSEAYDVCEEYGVRMLGWYHPDIPWVHWGGQKYTEEFLEKNYNFTTAGSKPVIYKASDPTQYYSTQEGAQTCLFIDYTHKNASNLIMRNVKNYLSMGNGLSGLMVDYGEYIQEDMLFANDRTGDEMHNLYAYYYNKAMKEAWDSSEKKDDNVLFARAGCAGSQSFAASFGGDQRSNFSGLQKAVSAGISASASGFSIWGSDIGGLSPERQTNGSWPQITEECYLRWLGFGTFSTLMRAHGWPDHNPTAFSASAQNTFKKYYWLRENLADAIYGATLQANADGTPVMQPMAMAFPEEASMFAIEDQYLFCNEILVCPVTTEGATSRTVTLPTGTWYSLWDGKKVTSNGAAMTVKAPVDVTPAYVRSGSIMPVEVAADSLTLMESMENKETVQAIRLTPNAVGESRTVNLMNDEGSFAYTSSTDASGTVISASQGNNTPLLIAYDMLAEKIVVDGKELPELYAKPMVNQVGYYTDEASNQTYIAIGSRGWRTVEIITDDADEIWDYEFSITKPQDNVSYLDKAFSVYKFNNPTSTTNAIAAVGPVTPSAIDEDSYNASHSYYTTKLYGGNTRGYLKPTHVLSGGFTNLAYKRNTFQNFEAEYEMFGTYSIFGIAFGGEAGVFPISKDSNAANDTGVVVYMENDGNINIGGTIDKGSVHTTGGVTADKTQSNLNGTENIRTSSVTEETLSVDANPTDSTATYTICLKVKDGTLTVWEKSNPDKTISVGLTSAYQGGAVSLISNQTQHGAFKSFRIRSLDEDMSYHYDFEHTEVSDLDESFTASYMNQDGTAKETGLVSEYWTRATGMAGGCANKSYLKPLLHRNSGKKYTFLTYERANVYEFETAVEIANNHVIDGLTVAPQKELKSSAQGISVYVQSNGEINITGAIDYTTAQFQGVTQNKTQDGYISGNAISGFKGVNIYASQDTIYTLRVTVKNGVLTVTLDEYPEVKVSVNLKDTYTGGSFSLYSSGYDQGGFKSMDMNVKTNGTILFERGRSENEVTYLVKTTENYGGISARIAYDKELYTYKDVVAEDGVVADARNSDADGVLQLYLYGDASQHMGEWATIRFTEKNGQSSTKNSPLSISARAAGVSGGGRRTLTVQKFTGDINDDDMFNVQDLVRMKKYEGKVEEKVIAYQFASDGTGRVEGKVSDFWSIGTQVGTYSFDKSYLRPQHNDKASKISQLVYSDVKTTDFEAKIAITNNYTQYGICIAPSGEVYNSANGIWAMVQSGGTISIGGAVDVDQATVIGSEKVIGAKRDHVRTKDISGFKSVNNNKCEETTYNLIVTCKDGLVTAYVEEYPTVKISVKTTVAYQGGAFSLYSTGCNQGGFKAFQLNYTTEEKGDPVSLSQDFETLAAANKLDYVAVNKENAMINRAVDIASSKNTALLRKRLSRY